MSKKNSIWSCEQDFDLTGRGTYLPKGTLRATGYCDHSG